MTAPLTPSPAGTATADSLASTLRLRSLRAEDAADIARITRHTGFFSDEEVAIAQELADTALRDGDSSGYLFVLAERECSDGARELVGYTCFGPIPATVASYDLYWIVVAPQAQRLGIGAQLLARSEQLAQERGAARMYIDTASRPQYQPTHAFYTRAGYTLAATLQDFYAPGDSKLIFVKSW